MADEDKARFRARDKKSVDLEVERILRVERARVLQVEHEQALNDMADSNVFDFAKQHVKATYIGGIRDGISTGASKIAEGVGWGFEKVMDPVLRAVGEDIYGMTGSQSDRMVKEFSGDIQRNTAEVSKSIGSALPEVKSAASTPEGSAPTAYDEGAQIAEGLGRSMP